MNWFRKSPSRIWDGEPLGFEKKTGRPLAHKVNGVSMTLGPPGSGKTVTRICGMLDEPGERTYIVWTPKAVLSAVTGAYRRRVCGSRNVHLVNATNILGLGSDGWNPIGHLKPETPELEEECAAVGNGAIMVNTHAKNPHFDEGACSAYTGCVEGEVVEAAMQGRTPTLAHVREQMTQEPKKIKEYIRRLKKLDRHGINTRLSKFFADTEEIENLKSTIEVQTSYETEAYRKDMSVAHGLNLNSCRDEAQTIFVATPPNNTKPQYLRLFFTAALRACYRAGGVPVTIDIDEGYVLGNLKELSDAAAVIREYDCRINICFQSIQQARELYQSWGMLTSGAVLAYRPADIETAEWMVKRTGQRYVWAPSISERSSPNDFERRSVSQQKRDRIAMDAMFSMPFGTALAWIPYRKGTFIVRTPGYWQIPQLNERAEPNPYIEARHHG